MSLGRRAWVLCLLAGLVPAGHADDVKTAPKTAATKPAAATPAATKPAAVPEADDDLLEFLGSVDSDTGDEDWLEYLSQTDVAKVAKAGKSGPSATEVKDD